MGNFKIDGKPVNLDKLNKCLREMISALNPSLIYMTPTSVRGESVKEGNDTQNLFLSNFLRIHQTAMSARKAKIHVMLQ